MTPVRPLPRMVATDLDGTLLRSDGSVSPYTADVLRLAGERGIEIIVVTARPPRWLDALGALTGSHGLVLCCNGGVLYEVDSRRVVESRPLPGGTVLDVAAALRASVPGIVFAVERVDGAGREPAFDPARSMPDGSPVRALDELLDVPVVKLLARCDAVAPVEFHARVAEVVSGRVELAYSGAVGLAEMTAPGVTKSAGLAAFCAARGVEAQDVWAFGDMPNDLPMLAWAGRAHATANASAEVIALADEMCASNDEDGVARTLAAAFGLDLRY